MSTIQNIARRYADGNLILQIIVGIIFGAIIASISTDMASAVSILGTLFVGALKGVAPILVFVLVATAIATTTTTISHKSGIKQIVILYLVGTFLAAFISVIASNIFPIKLDLAGIKSASSVAPQSIVEVFESILFKAVDNPINALATGNYIGILVWAIAIGVAMRFSEENTKNIFQDVSAGVLKIVKFIIRLAPFGIFGIVATIVSETGFSAFIGYGKLLLVLVGVMLFVAFVINPIMVFLKTKENPYPLIWLCVKESGVTAFFTRSSAANIPVNMNLCKKLNLNEDIYSISIPLGATMNMAGAAVTITVLTLAAVNTMGIEVAFSTQILLSIVAALSACGASGVAGGSLLLIPLSCSLFGINNDVALQIVAIGFAIGVIQDSVETALNSSTDVVFTAISAKKES